MLFNSYEFIFFFLPVVLAGFFALGTRGKARAAVGFLVVSSLFYYGWWDPTYLLLILASIGVNYRLGAALSRAREDGADGVSRGRWLLRLGVALNLGALGWFKYANFVVDNVNSALGSDVHLAKIVLPLAISFFTFQQIAYLVDSHRGEAREHRFLHYCLFVTFFPQLIAGPIVHHGEMLPQFADGKTYRFRAENLSVGATVFFIGLFKKVVFADTIAQYGTPVFDAAANGVPMTFLPAWAGALAYTLQIYFDFSGYSDMAIGLGRMFGVRLPLNFHSPYKAVNIIDFWRRWHMTLSRFLRDYLYIPLGGNRNGKLKRYRNLFLTMVLGGMWHGAGWTFLVWGTLHGVYLMINHAWHGVRRALGFPDGSLGWFGRGPLSRADLPRGRRRLGVLPRREPRRRGGHARSHVRRQRRGVAGRVLRPTEPVLRPRGRADRSRRHLRDPDALQGGHPGCPDPGDVAVRPRHAEHAAVHGLLPARAGHVPLRGGAALGSSAGMAPPTSPGPASSRPWRCWPSSACRRSPSSSTSSSDRRSRRGIERRPPGERMQGRDQERNAGPTRDTRSRSSPSRCWR